MRQLYVYKDSESGRQIIRSETFELNLVQVVILCSIQIMPRLRLFVFRLGTVSLGRPIKDRGFVRRDLRQNAKHGTAPFEKSPSQNNRRETTGVQ